MSVMEANGSATKGGSKEQTPMLKTLPGDDVRQLMWRFSDRYDLQMVVQSTRSVARSVAARLVADGERNTHEWTEKKAQLLKAYDEAGVTSVFADPSMGGFIEGPKNLALALVAFELAWVDGGAATCSLAGNLALAPIHEKGTAEQRQRYISAAVPGNEPVTKRGAFALTEPLPFVGVDTGVLCGKVRVAEWKEGEEPILQVEKRGRFITNMDFANFVTAAVDTDDPRIKSSCIIILEESDPGIFDRGAPTHKLVHQLSSTRDPIFNLRVPASRIVGGYTIKDGVIIPRYSHSEAIEAVFRRTRVPVGLMTSAKLLSAIDPVIRYQRRRFRGGDGSPGSPRYDLGLQMKEDALHRLVDVWATGEASASLGFATARLLDAFDSIEHWKDEEFARQGIQGARAEMKALKGPSKDALEYLQLAALPADQRDQARFDALANDNMVQYLVQDSLANILCPACKLWNTGHGANMMREAVSLMGGYGITEDCSGFLGQKWMDAQLEATYEGPEAVQRRHLSVTMTNEIFLTQFRQWIREMRAIAQERPGTGACTVATAMALWLWTLEHTLKAKDAAGKLLYQSQRQGVTFPLADALCWLLAARYFILDVMELVKRGQEATSLAEGLDGLVAFMTDLAHVQSARAAGEAARICAELTYGYNRHPAWEDAASCACGEEIDAIENYMPGLAAGARCATSVVEKDGSHAVKAGPCARNIGLEAFAQLRVKLDTCLTGARLAKDRAAEAVSKVMIPEAMDYPV